jgi:hypothetical protein
VIPLIIHEVKDFKNADGVNLIYGICYYLIKFYIAMLSSIGQSFYIPKIKG